MNFFPTVRQADCAEAVIYLPDTQMEISFRCDSQEYVAVTTVFEVSRMSTQARRGSLPSLSAGRRMAAKRLAVEAILRYRRDYAQRQTEKFRRPLRFAFC